MVAFAAWLLFGEDPSRWTILRAAIIYIANAYIAHREVQLARRAATNEPAEAAKPAEQFPRVPLSASGRGFSTPPGRSCLCLARLRACRFVRTRVVEGKGGP